MSSIADIDAGWDVDPLSPSERGELETLRAERDAADRTERRALVAELVKLGYEWPSTAWEGDADRRVPVRRLRAEPLIDLRARIEQLRKMPRPANLRPPASSGAGSDGEGGAGDMAAKVAKLSANQRKLAKDAGLTLEEFITRREAAVRRAQ